MRRRRRRLHVDEPLVRQHRLDDLARAAAARHDHRVRLLRNERDLLRVEVGEHRLARDIAVEPAILCGCVVVDRRVEIEDRQRREVVTLADRVVVEVVRGRDLDRAGAEFAVDVCVRDERNRARPSAAA